jgi:hypothetical protein
MRFAAFALIALLPSAANAQNIERIRITDGELSCRQIHDELGTMDKAITEAKQAQASSDNTAIAGQAGGVAAEVASRTGLFGQVGGLFGHIAGTVVAKTAADVTTQSGKQGVQQGIEREKQALARKEHLTTVFVGKGCKASDPDAPAANPNAALPLAQPATVAATNLPVEEILRQAGAGLSPLGSGPNLDRNNVGIAAQNRVIVPGYRVAFVVKTSASAYGGGALANVGSGYGSRTVTQAQNKRVEMALAGADMALLQGLTDRLHADFVDRLKAAGREVVDTATIAKTPGFEKLKPVTSLPYTASPSMQGDPRNYVVLTPKGLPLFFMHLDTYLGNAGAFDQEGTKAIHELAANLNSVAFIPTLQIDIAELESSGRSNLRAGAEADVIPKLGIGGRSELRVVTGKDAKIFFTGEMGTLIVKSPMFIDGPFGEVKTVEAFDTAGLANSLTAATGLQGAQHFVEKRELRVDRQKFAAGVLKAGATFNQFVIATAK